MDNVFRRELAFGLIPFETIYFDNGKAHFIEEHYKRHKRALRALGCAFDFTLNEYNYEIDKYLYKNNIDTGILKIVIFDNQFNFNVRKPSYTLEKYKIGLDIVLSKASRDNKNLLNYFKTYNYGLNYIEDSRAKANGFDTALFLNTKGEVAETCYANIFFRKGDKIYTPSITTGILNGILRQKVIDLCKTKKIHVEYSKMHLDELNEMDECFITNSAAGVFPVNNIGEINFLSRDFSEKINKEISFKREWNVE